MTSTFDEFATEVARLSPSGAPMGYLLAGLEFARQQATCSLLFGDHEAAWWVMETISPTHPEGGYAGWVAAGRPYLAEALARVEDDRWASIGNAIAFWSADAQPEVLPCP